MSLGPKKTSKGPSTNGKAARNHGPQAAFSLVTFEDERISPGLLVIVPLLEDFPVSLLYCPPFAQSCISLSLSFDWTRRISIINSGTGDYTACCLFISVFLCILPMMNHCSWVKHCKKAPFMLSNKWWHPHAFCSVIHEHEDSLLQFIDREIMENLWSIRNGIKQSKTPNSREKFRGWKFGM